MVCHETYKDQNNNWVNPEELVTINGKKFLKNDKNNEVKVGPSESMSKSKKNTIDPEKIIENYGADAVRLFILSDSPPEKDVQWSDEGMISSYKFLQKLWMMNQKILEEIKSNHQQNDFKELDIASSEFVKKVEKNIENFSYNKIIANFHEMYSQINKIINTKIDKQSLTKNYKNILITMMPVVPHFASECLKNLEIETFENKVEWPKINEDILIKKEVNFVIQINGKTREVLNLKKDIEEEDLLKIIQNEKKINNFIKNKSIKKTVFIKNKLVNLII